MSQPTERPKFLTAYDSFGIRIGDPVQVPTLDADELLPTFKAHRRLLDADFVTGTDFDPAIHRGSSAARDADKILAVFFPGGRQVAADTGSTSGFRNHGTATERLVELRRTPGAIPVVMERPSGNGSVLNGQGTEITAIDPVRLRMTPVTRRGGVVPPRTA